jgi:hypothetical protein
VDLVDRLESLQTLKLPLAEKNAKWLRVNFRGCFELGSGQVGECAHTPKGFPAPIATAYPTRTFLAVALNGSKVFGNPRLLTPLYPHIRFIG